MTIEDSKRASNALNLCALSAMTALLLGLGGCSVIFDGSGHTSGGGADGGAVDGGSPSLSRCNQECYFSDDSTQYSCVIDESGSSCVGFCEAGGCVGHPEGHVCGTDGSCGCADDIECNTGDICVGNLCLECDPENHSTCAGSPERPVCSAGAYCVECASNTHCGGTPETPICDTNDNICVAGCTGSGDCDGPTPICSTGRCVECTGPLDCPGIEVCISGSCGPPVSDCMGTHPLAELFSGAVQVTESQPQQVPDDSSPRKISAVYSATGQLTVATLVIQPNDFGQVAIATDGGAPAAQSFTCPGMAGGEIYDVHAIDVAQVDGSIYLAIAGVMDNDPDTMTVGLFRPNGEGACASLESSDMDAYDFSGIEITNTPGLPQAVATLVPTTSGPEHAMVVYNWPMTLTTETARLIDAGLLIGAGHYRSGGGYSLALAQQTIGGTNSYHLRVEDSLETTASGFTPAITSLSPTTIMNRPAFSAFAGGDTSLFFLQPVTGELPIGWVGTCSTSGQPIGCATAGLANPWTVTLPPTGGRDIGTLPTMTAVSARLALLAHEAPGVGSGRQEVHLRPVGASATGRRMIIGNILPLRIPGTITTSSPINIVDIALARAPQGTPALLSVAAIVDGGFGEEYLLAWSLNSCSP